MKKIVYKIIRKLAYVFFEMGGAMLRLLAKFYGQDAFYKIVGTRYGFNVDFVIGKKVRK